MSNMQARHRQGVFTEEEVLFIAAKRDFLVSKYLWRHEALRKLTRRMHREGKLKRIMFDGRNFYYRKAEMQ